MKLDGFERRTRALEARHQADEGKEEAARMQRFLEKHSDDELRRYGEIAEHHEAGIPLTVEEQSFLDAMQAKYGF